MVAVEPRLEPPAATVPTLRAVRRWRSLPPRERRDLVRILAVVAGLHVAGFALLLAGASHRFSLGSGAVFGVGTGLLAYTLGVRHAFDADHIAAIDNTTRQLAGSRQNAGGVGFFFSLGHSSVVLAMTVLLSLGVRALGAAAASPRSHARVLAGVLGTSVSGAFLLLIAALNAVVLVSLLRAVAKLRAGTFDEHELDAHLAGRGLMNRFFGPLARRIDTPWKMYPIGVLFGLGFDTASEVALLVLSQTAALGTLPWWAALSLPLLFAAGMSLFDTADSVLMRFAYGWAFARPARKLFYNVTITGLSVAVALFIGGIELLGLLATQLHLHGWLWNAVSAFDINRAGFVIVAMFATTWAVALAAWRFGRIEERWGPHRSEEARTGPPPAPALLEAEAGAA